MRQRRGERETLVGVIESVNLAVDIHPRTITKQFAQAGFQRS